jgi:hypothetical protein
MKPTIFIPSALAKLLIPVTPPSEFLPEFAPEPGHWLSLHSHRLRACA